MQHKRIVIKLGTSVLTGGSPRLNQSQMVEIARQCALLRRDGYEILLCSSGAIAAGREKLGFPKLAPTVPHKQMLAAVGQSQLMRTWEALFSIYDIHIGQVLLTRADVESRDRYLNARDTLRALLKHGILPILNENDAVATDEIKVGDNDNLSALAATLCEADLLILLTDIAGLYNANPNDDPNAELIEEVATITPAIKALAGGSVSGLGTGGMATKLQAAEIAQRIGCTVVIAAGREKDILLRLLAGERIGTRFLPASSPLEQRKRWILAGPRPHAAIVVDQGAEAALRFDGKSLLASGIRSVEGSFRRGDAVHLCIGTQPPFARGISRYDSEQLHKIAGMRSEAIASVLGHDYGATVIHRNDLILLDPTISHVDIAIQPTES